MTTTNDTLRTAFESIDASTLSLVRYAEEAVSSDVKIKVDDPVALAASRVHAWGVQYGAHASTEYLQYYAMAALKCAQFLMQREIDLAMNESWKRNQRNLWEGFNMALSDPPKNNPLWDIKKTYDAVQTRAAQSEGDPTAPITLDMTSENLDKVMALDDCTGMTITNAHAWLSHKILFATHVDEANTAIKSFQSEFSTRMLQRTGIPLTTPRTLQILRSGGIEELANRLAEHIKIQELSMTEEELEALDSSVAPVVQGTQVFDPIMATPEEMVTHLADKYQMAVIDYASWKKQGANRNTPCIVAKMDYRSIHPQIGLAQYVLVGPQEFQDVRIELKQQTVSGSASNKLPTTIYGLNKVAVHAPYRNTIVGVPNTTYFSTLALEFSELTAKMGSAVLFSTGPNVVEQLYEAADRQKQLFHHIQAAAQLLGMDTSQESVSAVRTAAKPAVKASPAPVTSVKPSEATQSTATVVHVNVAEDSDDAFGLG